MCDLLVSEVQTGSILPDPNCFPLYYLMKIFSVPVRSNQVDCYSFLQKRELNDNPYNLLWIFSPNSQGKYYLKLIPQNPQNYGAALKLDNQRMHVDLLGLVATANAESLNWKIVVNSNNQLYLCLSHSISVLELITTVYKLRLQAKQIMDKFLCLSQIRMYTVQSLHVQDLAQAEMTAQRRLLEEQIYKAVFTLEIRPLIRSTMAITKYNSSNEKELWVHQEKSFYSCLKQKRVEFTQKIASILQLQGIQQRLSTDVNFDEFTSYGEDIRSRSIKNERKSKKVQKKNVIGIKILKNIEEKDLIESNGSHSNIKLCRYELQILGSVNHQVNDFLAQHPQGRALQNSKQVELVKKICKDIHRETSRNAFLNETKFIMHIKQFFCKYAATFYIDNGQTRQKQQKYQLCGDQSIIMDYYPSTLQQMITKKSTPRFIDQLDILRQIADGLSWLYSLGICHRDIKPTNIMLDCNNVPKIIDFGSCCAAESLKKSSFEPMDSRLLTTPNYSLKFDGKSETLKKQNYTKTKYERHPLFDCYSFGKVMEEMIGDKCSMLGDLGNMMQYLWKSCQSKVPHNRPTYEQISYILARMIKWVKCLQEETRKIWMGSR